MCQPTFTRCATLISDTLNLYWKVESTTIAFALQGKVDADVYMAFGVTPNGGMIGSDATITGILNGEGFAIDYYLFGACAMVRWMNSILVYCLFCRSFGPLYLTAKNQCSYSGSFNNGVCPDPINNVELISASRTNGVSYVVFRRPISNSGEKETRGNKFRGIGPLTDGWFLPNSRYQPRSLNHDSFESNLRLLFWSLGWLFHHRAARTCCGNRFSAHNTFQPTFCRQRVQQHFSRGTININFSQDQNDCTDFSAEVTTPPPPLPPVW